MRAPDFWQGDRLLSRLLVPAAALYHLADRLNRARRRTERVPVPVICVGNLVAGGAGKTPVALALAERLRALGHRPHFLSRGHGGRLTGPLRVDPARHTAAEVGDEPLLLAAAAPAWIARHRPAGARAAAQAGATVIVMDDGFQNPTLARDLALVVVDGAVGFGNGRVLPAGPLREPVAAGLARADALVVIGADATGAARHLPAGRPILGARLVADGPDLAGQRVLAFAGIGRPAKFFATCADLGADLVGTVAFADHHPYTTADLAPLLARAEAAGARPVTTAKDAVRLPPDVRARVTVVPVRLAWDAAAAVDALLTPLAPPPIGGGDGAYPG